MSEQIIIEMIRQNLERNPSLRNRDDINENRHIESPDRFVLPENSGRYERSASRNASEAGVSVSYSEGRRRSPEEYGEFLRNMNEIIRSLVPPMNIPVDQPRRSPVTHHDYTENTSDTIRGHSENQIPRTALNFPEFDELMYLYHRNIQEYQYTVQEMTERMELNHRRNARQQNTLLDNFVYPYHRNMQEYNQVTLRCLDVLQNLHALRVTQPTPFPTQNNTQIPVPRPVNTSRVRSEGNNAEVSVSFSEGRHRSPEEYAEIRNRMRNRNIIPEIFNISRPIEYGFTFYPNVVPRNVITPQNSNHLLTPAQIALTTREYIFQESDRNRFNSTPVCPIMLEEFQIGNNIRQIVRCGHQFLSSSLERWFRRSCCCPVCRYNLWDISAAEPYRTNDQNMPMTTGHPMDLVVEDRRSSDLVVEDRRSSDHSRSNSMVDQDRLFGTEPSFLHLPQVSQRIIDIPLDTSTLFTTLPTSLQSNRTRTIPNMIDSSNIDTLESVAETTIRNWISSFLHNQPNHFPNIDLDISYTVEYDYPDSSNNSV